MVNKRKRTPPKRWVNINRYRKAREALDQIYKYHRYYQKPNQINELHDLAKYAQNNFESGGLQWPFDLEDDQLQTGISRANTENFHVQGGNWHKGYPFNPTSDQLYWINYNNAIQNDYKKHLHFRKNAEDFERLDNHVLRKFRW